MRSRPAYVIALVLTATALVAGCSTVARHPDKDLFGNVEKGKIDDSLANMDRVLGMENAVSYMRDKTEEARVAGRRLFEDPILGSNGRSCESCHPGGATTGGEAELPKNMGHGPYRLPIPSLVGAAARFPRFKAPNDDVITIEMMNNNCIRMFMKGKRLPLKSPESFYLAQYITSLSNGDTVQVGK